MYSFRYHLATICAIFLALAVGMLLGASIASSKMFEDTTSDAVQSLRTELDDIVSENQTLASEVATADGLSSDLLSGWSTGRLSGQHLIVVKNATPLQSDELSKLTDTLTGAGAQVSVASLEDTTLGLDDPETLAALQKVLPAVNGEEYATTLAQALVQEWTGGASIDAFVSGASADGASSGSVSTVVAREASVMVPATATDGTTSSSTGSVQASTARAHPLTDVLVSAGIVTLSGVDASGSQIADPLSTRATGLIDLCVEEKGNSSTVSENTPSPRALDLASAAHADSVPVVLAQTKALSAGLMSSASDLGVSGVIDMTTTAGRYSMVALFSGAEGGVYGMSVSGSQTYPAVPE